VASLAIAKEQGARTLSPRHVGAAADRSPKLAKEMEQHGQKCGLGAHERNTYVLSSIVYLAEVAYAGTGR